MGATQANLTVIDAALKPWQGVLCADSGHIHVHETGAVEATGHKCLVLAGTNGKITAAQIEAAVTAHRANPTHEHEVQPGMVYISNPTEWGTLYSKEELQAISQACRTLGLYLFVDGARMAYALASPANDVTLPDFAALCDAFYLGGTKCGALFGEALVLTNPALDQDFRYALKQHGGMLAKGRLLGLQFLALLGEAGDLFQTPYYQLAARANTLAKKICDAFTEKVARCYTVPPPISSFRSYRKLGLPSWRSGTVFRRWASRKPAGARCASAQAGLPRTRMSQRFLQTSPICDILIRNQEYALL